MYCFLCIKQKNVFNLIMTDNDILIISIHVAPLNTYTLNCVVTTSVVKNFVLTAT